MPCTSEGYSKPRPMMPDEVWRSFSRHHRAMEIELEAYREWVNAALNRLSAFAAVFPDADLTVPELPKQTPPWNGMTYRDANGKWPNDIRNHCDWLDSSDYAN